MARKIERVLVLYCSREGTIFPNQLKSVISVHSRVRSFSSSLDSFFYIPIFTAPQLSHFFLFVREYIHKIEKEHKVMA